MDRVDDLETQLAKLKKEQLLKQSEVENLKSELFKSRHSCKRTELKFQHTVRELAGMAEAQDEQKDRHDRDLRVLQSQKSRIDMLEAEAENAKSRSNEKEVQRRTLQKSTWPVACVCVCVWVCLR
jgi:chromosome segregation ATPase